MGTGVGTSWQMVDCIILNTSKAGTMTVARGGRIHHDHKNLVRVAEIDPGQSHSRDALHSTRSDCFLKCGRSCPKVLSISVGCTAIFTRPAYRSQR